jgi:flagellar basal body-associated protein FliL
MKKLLPIIGAIALLLLGGGGFFAYTKFLAAPSAGASNPAAAARQLEAQQRREMAQRVIAKAPGPQVAVGTDPFVVNLHDPGHYAKFTVVLKVDAKTPLVAGAASGTQALADQDEISDIINSDAYDYTANELISISGRNRFKAQIAADIRAHTDTLPLAVYFTTFAVQ